MEKLTTEKRNHGKIEMDQDPYINLGLTDPTPIAPPSLPLIAVSPGVLTAHVLCESVRHFHPFGFNRIKIRKELTEQDISTLSSRSSPPKFEIMLRFFLPYSEDFCRVRARVLLAKKEEDCIYY